MPSRWSRILMGLCGIVGVAALAYYYSVPVPLPPSNASSDQVVAFGTRYHDAILLDTWLQAVGSLLTVTFAVTLVHLAGATNRFAGWMTLLASGLTLAVALSEGLFAIAAAQAAVLGHAATALASFDLTNVFVYIFLMVPAPVFFLSLGAVLLGSQVLPRMFGDLALALGGAFAVLGLVGLFSAGAIALSILLLIGQELWIVAAAITLIIRAIQGEAHA